MEKELETQVLIIGAGTTGTAVAREPSKYRLDVILLEKGLDVTGGQTKCSAGMVYTPVGLTWVGSLVIKSIVDEPGTGPLHPESFKELALVITHLKVKPPVEMGQEIVQDILGTGVNLVSAGALRD